MIESQREGTSAKAVLVLALIFIFGMVAGASLFYVGQRSVGPDGAGDRPPPREGRRPPGPLADMTRQLGLTEEQRGQIREILDTYRGRMDSMLEESRLEIREVLTEEQQEQFDTMRPPRPGGPPPGPRRKGPRSKRPPRR